MQLSASTQARFPASQQVAGLANERQSPRHETALPAQGLPSSSQQRPDRHIAHQCREPLLSLGAGRGCTWGVPCTKSSVTLGAMQAFSYKECLAPCFNQWVTPKARLIQSLKALCRTHGVDTVADEAHISAENLRQIIAGTKLQSGEPRGVGPTLQRKLEAAYPGWADNALAPPSGVHDASASGATQSYGSSPVFEITTSDWGHLEAYKDMSEDDAAFIRQETERRHNAYKKLREEMFAKAGVPLNEQKFGHKLPMSPRPGQEPKGVLVKVAPPRLDPPAPKRLSSRYVANDKLTSTAPKSRKTVNK